MPDKKKPAETTANKVIEYGIGIAVATVVTGNPVTGVVGGVIGTAVTRKVWPNQ
jgi:hypothetical protein